MRKNPKAYYRYGEGSISHASTRPCKQFPGIHHPAIIREEWPSIWHYRWSRVADWLWERWWPGRTRFYEERGEHYYTWGRLGNWLFSQAHPDLPRLVTEIAPADSIRDTDWAGWDRQTIERRLERDFPI